MWSQHGPVRLMPKYCVSTRVEMACGGTERWVSVQSRQGALHQFAHEWRSADLHQLRHFGHQFGFADVDARGQHPARAAETALVGDLALPKVFARRVQRNRQAVGGDDGFQVGADVRIQQAETFAQVLVVVQRELARVRIQRKGAQGSGEPRQFQKKLLGMAAFGSNQVPQRSEGRIDGVQQPEVGDFARGELQAALSGAAC